MEIIYDIIIYINLVTRRRRTVKKLKKKYLKRSKTLVYYNNYSV